MAQATIAPLPAQAQTRSRPWSMVLPIWLLPTLIVGFAFAIRAFRLNHYSLWLDEVYTISYIRRPWMDVLGVRGAYDNHPPLYYALVKLIAQVAPESNAARILSLITGTATVGVLYLLAARLVSRPAGLLASFILAISPLHVWYSQEGRMFAPTAFAVTVSYYAMIRFLEAGNRRWGGIYTVTVLVSVLIDYSAVYALVPQCFVALYMARTRRRAILEWLATVALAGLAFVPWGLQALDVFDEAGERSFLFVTRQKIYDSILTIVGLPNETSYYWGIVPTPWSEWPHVRPIAIALVAIVLLLSAVTLSGRYRLGFVAGVSLFFGTIATTAFVSYLVSPGYADRTLVTCVVGWALLAGAAPFGRVPNGGRALSVFAVGALIALSIITSANMYREASKEPYREIAVAAGMAVPLELPIVADTVDPGFEPFIPQDVAGTSITTYEPDIDVRHPADVAGELAFWHAYADYTFLHEYVVNTQTLFASQDFERVVSMHFPSTREDALRFDLWVKEFIQIGDPQTMPDWPSSFGPRQSGPGWALDSEVTSISHPDVGYPELAIFGTTVTDRAATLIIPAEAGSVYLLGLDTWLQLPMGGAQAQLSCESTSAGKLETSTLGIIQPVDASTTSTSGPGWQTKRFAVLCPEGTENLRITLNNTAIGEVRFRGLNLSILSPPV